ncbi:MAG: hypothetical protein J5629_00625 [Muribaculaceae bacterium]|nr:hypothetical protein [Muribaculaceae bacterium]
MKRNFLIALSMFLCIGAFSLVLTACGDDEPSGGNTMKQVYSVKGTFKIQDGDFVGGYPGAADPDGKEFKFYEGIYNEVKEIIKEQTWEVTFKAGEKDQKIKEQNAVAEQRYSAMVKSLDAVQKKLDQTNKDTYKCHFSMTIELKAVGEKEILSGQKTLKYQGNE